MPAVANCLGASIGGMRAHGLAPTASNLLLLLSRREGPLSPRLQSYVTEGISWDVDCKRFCLLYSPEKPLYLAIKRELRPETQVCRGDFLQIATTWNTLYIQPYVAGN